VAKATNDHRTDATSEQWTAVANTLPPGADHTRVRAELERIRLDRSTPKQRVNEFLDQARLCRNFRLALPALELIRDRDALAEQLVRQAQWCDGQAKLFQRIALKRSPRRFLRQCEILWLWETIGGDLGVSTPRKAVGVLDEVVGPVGDRWPDPHGPVVSYFQAAAEIVFGKVPSAVRSKTVIMHYQHMNFSAAVLAGEGKFLADAVVVRAARP
jgi:hypothetical protein